MNKNFLLARLDQLIKIGEDVLSTRQRDEDYDEWVEYADMKGFRSASLSFIMRIYGSDHPHYTEFSKTVDRASPKQIEAGISILSAIRGEIDGDWLFSIRGLITAEVFADFLEMAEHLLENGYKDPAAVMVGSVLEEHLRQLCTNNAIKTEIESDGKFRPKPADRMNADLAKADVYNKLDQKALTTWLDLRNKAAHGRYGEYTEDQVRLMLQSVTDLMNRISS